MSDSARQPVRPEVTLFSGSGHTGDSCVLPMDGSTYSLKATGLKRIASVRVDWPDRGMAKPVVRLYAEVPTRHQDFAAGQGSAFKDFTADTVDTGKWAGAKCVKGYADDGRRGRAPASPVTGASGPSWTPSPTPTPCPTSAGRVRAAACSADPCEQGDAPGREGAVHRTRDVFLPRPIPSASAPTTSRVRPSTRWA